MPRDGSGVYTKPAGSTATTGTTILASEHNTPIDDLVTDANTARPVVAGGTGATTALAARAGLEISELVLSKSGAYTAAASDRSKLIRCTATLTLSLTAAATVGDGWYVDVEAASGTTTIDPDASETIDGAATLALSAGQTCRVKCNGTAFYSQFLGGLANVVEDTTPSSGGPFDMNGSAMQWAKGADVASAAELLVLKDGNSFDVTGTTTVTSIETTADAFGIGSIILLQFDGALILTHHATDLILPGGANITTVAGDTALFQKYAAGDWRCIGYKTTLDGLRPGTAANNIVQLDGSARLPTVDGSLLTNIPMGWKIVDGSGNPNPFYDFAVDGAVASVETPAWVDGYEYGVIYDGISSSAISDLQMQIYRETSAAYSSSFTTASGGTFAAATLFTGRILFDHPRFVLNSHRAQTDVFAATSGTFSDSAVIDAPSGIGMTHATAQAIGKVKILFSAGNIDAGKLYLVRRLESLT